MLEQQGNLYFLVCVRARDKARVRLRFKVKTERTKEPTAPGTPGLEKACQGNPSKAQILLVLYLSDWENS